VSSWFGVSQGRPGIVLRAKRDLRIEGLRLEFNVLQYSP
jgi:hypothetical protein